LNAVAVDYHGLILLFVFIERKNIVDILLQASKELLHRWGTRSY
jgi:hypothetical protein